MFKNLTRRSLLAGIAMVVGATDARAQSAHDIITRATEPLLQSGNPFRSTTILTEYIRGKAGDQTVLTVYAKEDKTSGQFHAIWFAMWSRRAMRERWRCWTGQNFWFYDPAAKSSVRISTQQRLVGQAAIGDVLTVNFAVDYSGTLLWRRNHRGPRASDPELLASRSARSDPNGGL